MAQATGDTLLAAARGFNQLSNARKIGLIVGLAALVSLVVVMTTYLRQPSYRVLFSNLSDRDGGAILGALSQMNVPYKMAEGGGAILVPAEVVYDTRLKLASQGLPRGGGVGFELMENQRFGTSQFVEQVNFQRALEGELARTIEALAPVQAARVHLAIPRPIVFVRDTQKPSASVMVSMFSGRVLDPGQVNGIVHLIASSVPDLSPRNVTVVDRTGTLLSGPQTESRNGALDAAQLKYLHQVEAAIAARIENIIKPITGAENVRAQVAATLDFSEVEQTSEIFKPNATAQDQAIRSQQSNESNTSSPQPSQGVPGALSNTPPGAASAPLSTPQAGAAPSSATASSTTSQREQTVNYEVDKTIRHTKGEIGAIKRLSVAVVVNYRRGDGANAKSEPLSEQEITQVTDLAREAMGFSRERGDTLNVVNAPFRSPPEAPVEAVPLWKDPHYVSLGMDIAKAVVVLIVGFVVLRMILSVLRDLAQLGRPSLAAASAGGGSVGMPGEQAAGYGPGGQPYAGAAGAPPESAYEADLRAAKEIARQDPRIVAQVVKDWVGRE